MVVVDRDRQSNNSSNRHLFSLGGPSFSDFSVHAMGKFNVPSVEQKKLNQCILKHNDKLLDLGVYECIAKTQTVCGKGLMFLLDFLVDLVDLQSCCEFQHAQLKESIMFAGIFPKGFTNY